MGWAAEACVMVRVQPDSLRAPSLVPFHERPFVRAFVLCAQQRNRSNQKHRYLRLACSPVRRPRKHRRRRRNRCGLSKSINSEQAAPRPSIAVPSRRCHTRLDCVGSRFDSPRSRIGTGNMAPLRRQLHCILGDLVLRAASNTPLVKLKRRTAPTVARFPNTMPSTAKP